MDFQPHVTSAKIPPTRQITVLDEFGTTRLISIPGEYPLTVFVDKQELVTLMTLGAEPEFLVLGFLRNQRLVANLNEIESVTVDWEVNAAAVKTRAGIDRLLDKTSKRTVTSGCGQGTVFGDLMSEIDAMRFSPVGSSLSKFSQSSLYGIMDTVRRQESIYRSAGSVHGCGLFVGDQCLNFVEDVGRHNAIDTIAGAMWFNDEPGRDKVLYTTGRLTSEMVIKSAQMGVRSVISRSGITLMGYEIGSRLGMTLFGRAKNRHYLCYCGSELFDR